MNEKILWQVEKHHRRNFQFSDIQISTSYIFIYLIKNSWTRSLNKNYQQKYRTSFVGNLIKSRYKSLFKTLLILLHNVISFKYWTYSAALPLPCSCTFDDPTWTWRKDRWSHLRPWAAGCDLRLDLRWLYLARAELFCAHPKGAYSDTAASIHRRTNKELFSRLSAHMWNRHWKSEHNMDKPNPVTKMCSFWCTSVK